MWPSSLETSVRLLGGPFGKTITVPRKRNCFIRYMPFPLCPYPCFLGSMSNATRCSWHPVSRGMEGPHLGWQSRKSPGPPMVIPLAQPWTASFTIVVKPPSPDFYHMQPEAIWIQPLFEVIWMTFPNAWKLIICSIFFTPVYLHVPTEMIKNSREQKVVPNHLYANHSKLFQRLIYQVFSEHPSTTCQLLTAYLLNVLVTQHWVLSAAGSPWVISNCPRHLRTQDLFPKCGSSRAWNWMVLM